MTTPSKKTGREGKTPQMDDILRRMLSTPPKPHKENKAKPAEQPAKNKPAK